MWRVLLLSFACYWCVSSWFVCCLCLDLRLLVGLLVVAAVSC